MPESPSSWRTRLPTGGGLLFLATLGAAWAGPHPPVMDFVPPAPGTYKLERIQPAADGTVLDARGRQRKLADFSRGKVSLLTFMYASCADPAGCPYALTVMHQVKEALEILPEARGRVRFVSLSFDPERDTPRVLAHYGRDHAGATRHVDWAFLTTRSRSALLPIVRGFGQDVGVNIDRATGKPTGIYSHVLKVFLIDPHGSVREIYTTDYLLPAMVLNDIRTLLMEEGVRPK